MSNQDPVQATVNPIIFPDDPSLKPKENTSDQIPLTSRVLCFTIMNSLYPITTDIISQICRPCGTVLRICIIRRRGVQALVEFDSMLSAMRAKASLNGADIYQGCCTVKINYAKNAQLVVFRNDTESWDYTKAIDLETGKLVPIDQVSLSHQANGNLEASNPANDSILKKISNSIPNSIQFGNPTKNSDDKLITMADLQHGNVDPATGECRQRIQIKTNNHVKYTFEDPGPGKSAGKYHRHNDDSKLFPMENPSGIQNLSSRGININPYNKDRNGKPRNQMNSNSMGNFDSRKDVYLKDIMDDAVVLGLIYY